MFVAAYNCHNIRVNRHTIRVNRHNIRAHGHILGKSILKIREPFANDLAHVLPLISKGIQIYIFHREVNHSQLS